MLYDGAIRFLQQATAAMDAGNTEIARQRIFRADNIIDELNNTLDMNGGGEVAERLRSIYLWTKRQIMESVIEGDSVKIEQSIESLAELREAWVLMLQNSPEA
jgi:flagellar protein FliS